MRKEFVAIVSAAYAISTIVFAVTGGLAAGWQVGANTLFSCLLFCVSGGRLRQLLRGDYRGTSAAGDRRLAGFILAFVIAGFAFWLSGSFSVRVGSVVLDGWIWGVLGFIVAFVTF